MGNLLRRYWHPIATATELEKEPVLAVKLLGENLALYRSPDGELGLMAERCPHRGASMVYGIPEDGGLRCPYHGWKFSNEGVCLEQPAEPENSTFKHRVRIPAYPGPGAGRPDLGVPRPGARAAAAALRPACARRSGRARSASATCRATGCSAWRTRMDPIHFE